MAELREISIEADIPYGTVYADRNWTTEATVNIIKNCIEHTENGGSIKISACEATVSTIITISDNGSGISEKDMPHIFQRFYKADNVLHQGYGIGLAFSKQIIAAQDGVIKARNILPNGTEFTIMLYKMTI